MKRDGLLGFLILLSMPFVSAQYFYVDLRYGAEKVVNLIIDFASPFFGAIIGEYSGSEFFFAKVLLLILLYIIIYFVLAKVGILGDPNRNKFPYVLVAAVISILAVRFIQENDLVNGILLPYGTMGVAITTILPFMIFFYFLHFSHMGGIGRRLGWIFYGIIFLALWNAKYSELSSISNQIYGWMTLIVLLALIFDKKIHNYFAVWELNTFYRGANQKEVASLQAEYMNIMNVDSNQAERRRDRIRQRLNALGANTP